jgi:hypothetical protein
MAARILVLSVVTAIGLAGCAAAPGRPEPPPPATARVGCNTAGGAPCRAAVAASVVGGACVASAPDIELAERNRVRLVWNLPEGFLFCPTLGDGVWLKTIDDDDQFGDFRPTNNANGDDDEAAKAATDKCRRNFRIVDRYSVAREYPYLLRFHDKTGKISCTVDPYIRNG